MTRHGADARRPRARMKMGSDGSRATTAIMPMLAKTLPDMFVMNLPVLEKIVRPIVVYFAIVVLLRIFGKRELAQLNPFDLVVLLSVSTQCRTRSSVTTIRSREEFLALSASSRSITSW